MSPAPPGATDAAIIVLRSVMHPSAVIDLYHRAGASDDPPRPRHRRAR